MTVNVLCTLKGCHVQSPSTANESEWQVWQSWCPPSCTCPPDMMDKSLKGLKLNSASDGCAHCSHPAVNPKSWVGGHREWRHTINNKLRNSLTPRSELCSWLNEVCKWGHFSSHKNNPSSASGLDWCIASTQMTMSLFKQMFLYLIALCPWNLFCSGVKLWEQAMHRKK